MIRFAILKDVGNQEEAITLEYREDQLLERISNRTTENLAAMRKIVRSYSKDQILNAIKKAWIDLITEFKEETIKLK